MEAKTLLRLIKDDIAHLEGITSDFTLESLPLSDEVELALVRAKALLRELELLHKIAVQHENIAVANKPAEEPKIEIPEYQHSGQEPFEFIEKEHAEDKQKIELKPDLHDLISSEIVHDSELNIADQHNTDEIPETSTNTITDNEHFSALVEPAEPFDVEMDSPVISEMEPEEHIDTPDEFAESVNLEPESPNLEEEEAPKPLTDSAEPIIPEIQEKEAPSSDATAIVSEIQDQKGEIVAEEFKEVKKTLNETLGDSRQISNDAITIEKEETVFQIIPINSIWDGIGINDRFLFIRELFANSSAKFETTVASLDKLTTIQEAVDYLKMNFKWNKTEASQKFLILVKRRFTN